MRTYCLTHMSDAVLVRDLKALIGKECTNTALVLAHIAEVDARRLYLPAGYPSMFAYCVGELHLSEDAASKRIQAARAARQFPAMFMAVAEGRLHLAGVCLLAPHLTPENGNALLAAATYQTKSQIKQLLAQRFPRTELLPLVQAIPARSLGSSADTAVPFKSAECVGTFSAQHAPGHVDTRVPRPRVAPLATDRFALQFTIGKGTHDKLCYVQALLSHRLPSDDIAQVFDLSLEVLTRHLEKQKFAATPRPRSRRRPTGNPRTIPAHVKREVWERDQGQCTFVSAAGQRCPARKLLEFDHIDEVARGGQATTERMRLRCRSHNQYGAECTFGREFMENKREAARIAAKARAAKAAADDRGTEQDVVPWLRRLGFRADEARRAAASCNTIPDAPLEERVRVALSHFHSRASSHVSRAP